MQAVTVPTSSSEDSTEASIASSDGEGRVTYYSAVPQRMRQHRMRRMRRMKERVPNLPQSPPKIKKQIPSRMFAQEAKSVPEVIVTKTKNMSGVAINEADSESFGDPDLCSIQLFSSDSSGNEEEEEFVERVSERAFFSAYGEENVHTKAPVALQTSYRLGIIPNGEINEEDKTPAGVGNSPRGVSSPFGSTQHVSSAPFSGKEVLHTKPYQRCDHDIDEDVRQSIVFFTLRKQMLKPSPQLDELLTQIRGDCTELDNRAFATRRKNACGALKILAAKKENRLKICWTSGVLLAMASVLRVRADIKDAQNMVSNIEARNRIVSTLCILALEKKNHLLLASTPGLLDSMAETILHDEGEGRQGCCTVMFQLSKTAETKAAIAKNKELMFAITKVIEVPTWIPPQQPQIPDVCKFDMQTVDTRSTVDELSCTSSEDYHDLDCISKGYHFAYTVLDRVDKVLDRADKVLDRADEVLDRADKVLKCGDMQEDEKRISFTLSYEKFVDTSEPLEIDYDLDPNKFLHGSRLMAFASLLCLVKNEETVTIVAREHAIVETLLKVSLQFSSPSHVRALAILAHMTRHPQNCHLLVHKNLSFLPLLQEVASDSPDSEGRRYALCALQNLSVDTSCRTAIACTPNLMKCLVNRLKDCSEEETLAAIATLQHLADEPANLDQFIAVKECVSSIIELSRSGDSGATKTGIAAFLAKNTLATLSHWFRRIATDGSERIVSESGCRDPLILHNAVLQPLTYRGWS